MLEPDQPEPRFPFSRVLLVGSYDSTDARLRSQLLNNHPKISPLQISTVFLFNTEAEYSSWFLKCAVQKQVFVRVAGTYRWRNIKVRITNPEDSKKLRRHFLLVLHKGIVASSPEVVMIHLGEAMRLFHFEVRGAVTLLKARFPWIRVAVDASKTEWRSRGHSGLAYPIFPNGEMFTVYTHHADDDDETGMTVFFSGDEEDWEPKEEREYGYAWPFEQAADLADLATLLRSEVYAF